MVRLVTVVKAVFVASLVILAVMPFIHSYLQYRSEAQAKQNRIEVKTQEVVETLKKLKTTTTVFDQFMDEREKRRRERLAERERAAQEQAKRREGETVPEIPPPSDIDLKPTDPRAEFHFMNGPVQRYIDANDGALPVLVVCHNRAEELAQSLDALLSLEKINRKLILVSQDGSSEAVRNKVNDRNLAIVQNLELERMHLKEGGGRIAAHYKYSLEAAFQKFSDAPAIVVMEDDLMVSPDFLDFITAGVSALESDPTLWCVSAWNDNGFKGMVKDEYGVRRTNLFPGLGWLLLRSEFESNLKRVWPEDNWDWFVRGVYQRAQRECIYPEISRTFHAGRIGTFVNTESQRLVFDRMERNTRTDLDWTSYRAEQNLQRAISANYETYIESFLKDPRTVHVSDPAKFEDIVKTKCEHAVVVWYTADPDPAAEVNVIRFARYFGIWHQLLRASHEAMHEIYYKDCHVFLINVVEFRPIFSLWFTSYAHTSKYASLRPAGLNIFSADQFIDLAEQGIVLPDTSIHVGSKFNESCNEVCLSKGLRCDLPHLFLVNNCQTLRRYFSCQTCQPSYGSDQPCFVDPSAPVSGLPGLCLISTGSFLTCDGKHALTKRLCVCI